MAASLDWRLTAGRQLLELRTGPGWGYAAAAEASVEPTSLAGLALRAVGMESSLEGAETQIDSACEWLAELQQTDGSVGLSAAIRQPRWPTSFAVLLWSGSSRHQTQRDRAADWLERQRGKTLPKAAELPVGHDSMIDGWPWVDGTHPWVEPTAMAVMALCRAGRGDSPRVADGKSLLLDRAIPTGGWNYGNNTVFGKTLKPLPGPTGGALLALAIDRPQHPAIEHALDYLNGVLDLVQSPEALAWSILGLSAWQ